MTSLTAIDDNSNFTGLKLSPQSATLSTYLSCSIQNTMSNNLEIIQTKSTGSLEVK